MTKSEAIAAGIEAESMLYDPIRKNDSQLHFIYDLAEIAPDGPALEVGVFRGGSMVTWGQARKGRGPIIAVENRRTQGYGPALLAKMAKYGLDIELIEVASWEGPAHIDGQVAFCFIDADHGENGIPKDIKVWPGKIMPGGIIAFHDYDVWKPNVVVKREVDAWQAETSWGFLGLVGALIAYRRPVEP